MKKLVFAAATMFMLSMGFMSCTGNKTNEAENSASTEASTEMSTEASAETSAAPETEATSFAELIKSNEGKNALDAKLFDNEVFKNRVKALAAAEFDSIMANFNTQTPITGENGIYKMTGGRAHNVPEFLTTIIYDANNDNLNITIEKSGKITTLKEKEEIKMTETLKKK